MLMNSAGEIFRWWLGPANTDEREMLDASAIPVRRQGADLRRLGRPVSRARCRFDDAAAGKHEGRPSAVADPAGDASAARDRDGFGRLVEDFGVLRNKGRDFWRWSARFLRKILAYNLSLRFERTFARE